MFMTAGIQYRIHHLRQHAANAFVASRCAPLQADRLSFLDALHTCSVRLEAEYGELAARRDRVRN